MRDVNTILDSIKVLKGIKKDRELARLLDVSPSTISNWRARNTIPYKELSLFCEREGLSISSVLSGKGPLRFAKERKGTKDDAPEGFVFIPQVSGEISAGAGLVPVDLVEMRIAFREDWIRKKGDPEKMSLIRVRGDSMEPTLLSGDIVLVDHGRNYFEPEGGLYALVLDHQIIVKRIQVLNTEKKIRIISDNPRYPTIEADPEEVEVNGKVIWFARELER